MENQDQSNLKLHFSWKVLVFRFQRLKESFPLSIIPILSIGFHQAFSMFYIYQKSLEIDEQRLFLKQVVIFILLHKKEEDPCLIVNPYERMNKFSDGYFKINQNTKIQMYFELMRKIQYQSMESNSKLQNYKKYKYKSTRTNKVKKQTLQSMRLDASYLHFISQQQLRVLTSIQLGMRNHQWVPVQVIARIAKLRGGQTFKVLRKLLKNKFIVHTGKNYSGYKLAYLGYDYLSLHTFIKRGILKDVISKIGVGKESDIYKCITPDGDHVVLKLTRLGRNSFRSVKKNREYIQHRTNYNWLYLSRLSSMRQFLFMQLLHENKFDTPIPIDTNRHGIVMSLVDGQPLCHIQRINSQQQIKTIFQKAREMLIQFAQNGLIHGDYNQFNLMTNQQGTKLTVIDFPQCISINHPNADMYFNRDVQCIYIYFDKMVQRALYLKQEKQKQIQEGDMQTKKFILNVADYPMPVLKQIEVIRRLDHEIKTRGHITLTQEKQLEEAQMQLQQMKKDQNNEDQEQGDEEDEDEENQKVDEQNSQQNEQNEENNKNSDSEQDTNQIKNQHIKEGLFDQTEGQIQSIQHRKNSAQHHQLKEGQIYDKELQILMSQLNQQNFQPNTSQEAKLVYEANEQSQQQREQFKGLTAFQIRQKIKAEKKLQRENRKKQMTQDEYIKNAVKRSKRNSNESYKNIIGNRGNKKKNKSNTQAIKQGLELGF